MLISGRTSRPSSCELLRPLSVTETNDFGADDTPVGTSIRLAYDPEALVAISD
ncbi:hypothetical protein X743_03760 [Mesorhizobium sp. LNHC252B00]|nr:hypothetical protein X743_03760 [Mesorhizobium sp. LNHC252B00]